MKKRSDLQGIRGIAIIFVVIFHFFQTKLPNGWVGVDMFFVLSGYLMMSILTRMKDISFSNIFSFYYRRFKRILPLYYAVILVVLILLIGPIPEEFADNNHLSSVKAVTLTYNIKSDTSTTKNYNDLLALSEDMFTHTWSLCLEMQWYLIVPFIVFLSPSPRIRQAIYYITLISLSLAYSLSTSEIKAFFTIFARTWQFCIGMLAFALTKKSKQNYFLLKNPEANGEESESDLKDVSIKNLEENASETQKRSARLSVELLMTGMVIGTVLLVIFGQNSKTITRITVTVATAATIYSGENSEMPLLSNRILAYIGDISYVLYLVHWPVYILCEESGKRNVIALYAGLGASVALSIFLHHLFELFYMAWPKSRIYGFVSFTGLLCLLLSTNMEALRNKIHGNMDLEQWFIVNNKGKTGANGMPDTEHDLSMAIAINIAAGGLSNSSDNCVNNEFHNISGPPPLNHYNRPHGLFVQNETLKGNLTFITLGNSWSLNQGAMFYKAFKKYARNFYIFGLHGCESLMKSTFAKWCEQDFGRILCEGIKPDVIVILQRYIEGKSAIAKNKALTEDWIVKQYLEYVKYYARIAKKVYIEMPLPDCSRCVQKAVDYMKKHNTSLASIGGKLVNYNDQFARKRILAAVKGCKNCEVFDFKEVMSDKNGKMVPYDVKKNLIYFDNQVHMTTFGKQRAQIIVDRLARRFDPHAL